MNKSLISIRAAARLMARDPFYLIFELLGPIVEVSGYAVVIVAGLAG
jgi:hypothetical protein